MSEIELKFGLADAAVAAVDAALRRYGAKEVALTSHYWDTPERHLGRAGLALRLRRLGERWEQTLKAAGPNPAERLEETVPRPGQWDDNGPAPEVSLHAGSKAGALLDATLSPRKGRVRALELAYTSVIDRLVMTLVLPDADVEIAFDRGAIQAGERSLPVREVEIELKRGDVGALIALGRANVDVHAMWLSTLSKSERGGQLALGREAQAAKARPPRLDRSSTGPELFRAIVASCMEQVLANASLLAAGNLDDDIVHQLRVGIRRMRTAARELGAWRESLDPGWESPLADVFRALGAYRDRKTVAATIEQRLAAAGSPDPKLLAARSSGESIDPASIARGRSFQHALLDVLAFLVLPDAIDAAIGPNETDGDDVAPKDRIGRRLDKLHARLQRDAKHFEELDPLARHGVRKRLKRLRYLAELVGPLYKTTRVGTFLTSLEPAQDELGKYIDLIVAARLAREVVERGDPRSWFNIGWLKAQVPPAIDRSGRALREVADAKRFWD